MSERFTSDGIYKAEIECGRLSLSGEVTFQVSSRAVHWTFRAPQGNPSHIIRGFAFKTIKEAASDMEAMGFSFPQKGAR